MGDGLESRHAGGSKFSALSALYSAERAAELGDRKMFFDVLRVMLTVVAVTGVLGGSWGGVLPWYLYAMIGFCVLGLIAYLTQLLAIVKVRNVSVGILEEPLVRAALLEENRIACNTGRGEYGCCGCREAQCPFIRINSDHVFDGDCCRLCVRVCVPV